MAKIQRLLNSTDINVILGLYCFSPKFEKFLLHVARLGLCPVLLGKVSHCEVEQLDS